MKPLRYAAVAFCLLAGLLFFANFNLYYVNGGITPWLFLCMSLVSFGGAVALVWFSFPPPRCKQVGTSKIVKPKHALGRGLKEVMDRAVAVDVSRNPPPFKPAKAHKLCTIEDVEKAADAGTFGPADMGYKYPDDPVYRARTWETRVSYPEALLDRFLDSTDPQERLWGEMMQKEQNGHPECQFEYPAPNALIALKTAMAAIKESSFPFNQAVVLEIANRD